MLRHGDGRCLQKHHPEVKDTEKDGCSSLNLVSVDTYNRRARSCHQLQTTIFCCFDGGWHLHLDRFRGSASKSVVLQCKY